MTNEDDIVGREKRVLKEAKEAGILDVDIHGDAVDTLELATQLTKKWAPIIHNAFEKRRKAQEMGIDTSKLSDEQIQKLI